MKKRYFFIGLGLVLLLFLSIRTNNGRLDTQTKAILSQQKILLKKSVNPQEKILIRYEMAVLKLKAGRILQALSETQKINQLTNKNHLNLKEISKNMTKKYITDLGLNPKQINTLYYLSILSGMNGEFSASIKYLDQIIALNSQEHFAYALKGYILFQERNLSFAKITVQKALVLKPHSSLYYYLLSEIENQLPDQKKQSVAARNLAYRNFILGN